MILPEVGTFIASLSTALTVGTNVFLGKFPISGPNTCIALFESGGAPPQLGLGNTVIAERPALQVISRSTSYATARSNAQTIWDGLVAVANSTLSTTYYLSVIPQQSPFDIGEDGNERHQLSCNFLVTKETT